MSKSHVRNHFALALTLFGAIWLFRSSMTAEMPSWDTERLNLEVRMQQRVEEALAKILTPGQFVVVVRVEPIQSGDPDVPRTEAESGADFYLPGVPVKQNYDGSEQVKQIIESVKPQPASFKRFIKRITATLVVDQTLPDGDVTKVRELTRQMLGLDPARGDTLDIQKSVFKKVAAPIDDFSGAFRLQKGIQNFWPLILLSIALFSLAVFILFMFGPLRGFLNNFVRVLPTLKPADVDGRYGRGGMDLAMFQAMMPPSYAPPALPGGSGANFSGSLQVENPNKISLPFGFIREDHLANLAVLLAREAPEKAAVVLGYLPPEWISKVLGRLDPAFQSDVASNLATTRQLLPEQVEDIEQDLRRRLDYLVGGPDRIFAVYESLDPEAQKRMLESLRDSRPEIVEELRRRTLVFEDLDKLEAAALKSLLREVDLQTLVMALRGATPEIVAKVLENVTEGKAAIVKEELELSENAPTRGVQEAQRKIMVIARRLQREGQINIPQIADVPPASRYPNSLRSTLKLPPGMRADDTAPTTPPPATPARAPEDVEEKIRKFMNRRQSNKERYPTEGA